MDKVTIYVEGMSCQHCVNSIKNAVGGLNGIGTVDVDLREKTVWVEYDPNLTSLKEIEETIIEQGYEINHNC